MDPRVTRILLVEDNPGDASLTRELLSEKGSGWFELIVVDRLGSAFKQLSRAHHDVILLDLTLPDSHGLDTFQRVQAVCSGLPIVVVSELQDEDLALKAVQQGAQDYVVKSRASSEGLLRIIRYAIERRRLEDRYRTLVSNIPGAVYRSTWDLDWKMLFLSDAIFGITGYPASDFLDGSVATYENVIHPEDRGRVLRYIASTLVARVPYQVTYRVLHATGEVRWVSDRGQGIFAQDGTLSWLDGVISDITATRRMEDELRRRVEQLRRAQKMEAIGGLAAGLTHDFNNVLTIINSYADILLARMGPDDINRPDTEQIMKAGRRAVALTRRLNALDQRQAPDGEVLDLNLLAAEMAQMPSSTILPSEAL